MKSTKNFEYLNRIFNIKKYFNDLSQVIIQQMQQQERQRAIIMQQQHHLVIHQKERQCKKLKKNTVDKVDFNNFF